MSQSSPNLSPTIQIRRATVQDASAYARIMSHAEVLPGLLQVPFNDETMWAARLADILGPGKLDLPLVAEINGQVVGNAGLHPCMPLPRRRHAASIGLAVEHSNWGRGVGSALMAALCDYADNWGHYLRLELGVFSDNISAIALYQKFGFIREGTHRAYALRNGKYADTDFMARLHPHSRQLPC